MKENPIMILNLIAQTIFDKKGFNILALDVQGVSTITDYLLIAEGNVNRHVKAMAQTIIQDLEKKGIKPHQVEGVSEGDWIVIDYTDIIVHLFMPGLRDKYQLEKLWQVGKIVDLEIDVGKEGES
ncbi:MAG: ribosome silencing factor [Chlamydiota bacterium]